MGCICHRNSRRGWTQVCRLDRRSVALADQQMRQACSCHFWPAQVVHYKGNYVFVPCATQRGDEASPTITIPVGPYVPRSPRTYARTCPPDGGQLAAKCRAIIKLRIARSGLCWWMGTLATDGRRGSKWRPSESRQDLAEVFVLESGDSSDLAWHRRDMRRERRDTLRFGYRRRFPLGPRPDGDAAYLLCPLQPLEVAP